MSSPFASKIAFESSTDRDTGTTLILLSGRDLLDLLEPRTIIEGLRQAYKGLAANRADRGQSLAFAIDGGSAHVKAGLLPGSRAVLAAKVNVNLPDNRHARGLPTIQGAVLLADTRTGRPLAVMDSMTLTGLRTAATAMLAATFGARKDSKVAAIIGCGAQAVFQLAALRATFPVEDVRVFDLDHARAEGFAAATADGSHRIRQTANVAEAVDSADICITCTTSTHPVLTNELMLRGCFVAAMGADNPDKCEIEPALMARACILVDDLEQCAAGGDLRHALAAGSVSRGQAHADLAELAAGQKIGRRSADEVVIFDSCGSGVQDVATAWMAYQAADVHGLGTRFDLAG